MLQDAGRLKKDRICNDELKEQAGELPGKSASGLGSINEIRP